MTADGISRQRFLSHLEAAFAGATFSPDGSTLFVNLQSPGLTFAMTGPWRSRPA
jgi:secreted PhoX family phosphatase